MLRSARTELGPELYIHLRHNSPSLNTLLSYKYVGVVKEKKLWEELESLMGHGEKEMKSYNVKV